MNIVSKKCWVSFFIIVLVNICTSVFGSGFEIYGSALNIIICLFLIRNYLNEPLEVYGLYIRNIHMQIVNSIILSMVLIFYLYNGYILWETLPFKTQQFIGQFSSCAMAFMYFLGVLISCVSQELIFRGFLLSFFGKIFNNPLVSVFVSAILYGAVHSLTGYHMLWVIFYAVIGIIHGYLRIKEPDKFTVFSLSLSHFIYDIFVDMIEH